MEQNNIKIAIEFGELSRARQMVQRSAELFSSIAKLVFFTGEFDFVLLILAILGTIAKLFGDPPKCFIPSPNQASSSLLQLLIYAMSWSFWRFAKLVRRWIWLLIPFSLNFLLSFSSPSSLFIHLTSNLKNQTN